MLGNNTILTPVSLWENFDSTLPLKPTTLKEFSYDNISYKEMYFSGREVLGERVRIFALYVVPLNREKYNAILYVPDIGEKVDYQLVNDYIKMGYAVLVADLYGEREGEENYTVYPKSIPYANYEKRDRRMDYVDDTAKETSWYEWVAVEKYALNFLRSQSEVEKIGVIGIKEGANVVWQVLATEEDITCGIILFGAGWRAYKGINKYSDEDLVLDDERRRYVAGVEAQSYAQYVKCPVLYMTATNSKDFDFDRAQDTVSRLNGNLDCHIYFSIGYNNFLDENSEKDVELFLKSSFGELDFRMANSPEIEIVADGNYLRIEVEYDDSKTVSDCFVYVNEGMLNPSLRCWNICNETGKAKGKSFFEYVLSCGQKEVYAIAVVRYDDGESVSSKPYLKKIDATSVMKSNLIYTGRNGLGGISLYDGDMPTSEVFVKSGSGLELVEGAEGIKGAYSPCGIISYKIGEPCVKISENTILKFDVYLPSYSQMKLTLKAIEDGEEREYYYQIEMRAGNIWQNVVLNISDFKSEDNIPIKAYDGIKALKIVGEGKFIINNILVI